jgi:regulator of protease activity HflC (stomatin/prohibitin superfamily)
MDLAFGWIGQIFEALLQMVPRLIIIRNTHACVKWKTRGRTIAIPGGRRTFYWPLVTDIERIVVARQTINLATQCLMTKDDKQVVVGGYIVCHVNDVLKAIAEKNWDVDSTVGDITMATMVGVVMKHTLSELMDGIAAGPNGEFMEHLTGECRRQLRMYGVYIDRAGITDFATCRVYKILGAEVKGMI